MGRDLADSFPVARRVFEGADDRLGLPLSRLCFVGPADALVMVEDAAEPGFKTPPGYQEIERRRYDDIEVTFLRPG